MRFLTIRGQKGQFFLLVMKIEKNKKERGKNVKIKRIRKSVPLLPPADFKEVEYDKFH